MRDGDLALVHGSADWLGVNYYTPYRLRSPNARLHAGRATRGCRRCPSHPCGPRTAIGWEVDGCGLEHVLLVVANVRPGLPLVVTENGAAYDDVERDARHVIVDHDRVGYLRDHLAAAGCARAAGADVRGYLVWTLLDNFESAEGYTKKFGVVHIDPQALHPHPQGFLPLAGRAHRLRFVLTVRGSGRQPLTLPASSPRTK